MNKQKIQNEINKTKKHLAKIEKMLEECKYERWKPKEREIYYLVDTYNKVLEDYWIDENSIDKDRYNIYNCFKTKEEAEAEAEKILVRRQLEDIARRLNKGREINWDDDVMQLKHFIYVEKQELCSLASYTLKTQGTVYCLDENFKDVAIKEIGEERLKKYLRGE